MDFEITKRTNYTWIKVCSDKLDTNNAPDLKSELVAINGREEKNIILDLNNCSYSDSSGLSAILVANRLCEDADGLFILTGLHPNVEQIIKVTMLHTVLNITETLEEAKEHMKEWEEKQDNQ